jgi:dienelactone hydrolase
MQHRTLASATALALSTALLAACAVGAGDGTSSSLSGASESNATSSQGSGSPSTGTPSAQGSAATASSGQPSGGAGGASSAGDAGGASSAGDAGSSGGDAAADPTGGAGPKPTGTCAVTKDSSGFFTRSSSLSSYVAYVPASYKPTTPMRLIVGLHGCGDTAYNYATWGVNPYDTRTTQDHIGISIGGQDGNCWTAADDAKVLAAVQDISTCFWVHQKKVVIAGFSSGGELSYRLGLSQASRFAGILIEDSGLYAANNDPNALLANASWKLPIAHLAHTSDTVFPLATVKADWTKTAAAGFPLTTKEVAGTHDGTSTDWATWLIPQSSTWTAP